MPRFLKYFLGAGCLVISWFFVAPNVPHVFNTYWVPLLFLPLVIPLSYAKWWGVRKPTPHASIAATESEFGLLILAPGTNPTVDIVAIHGLDGHREMSWMAENGVIWLRDLLPPKIPNARIMSYGYDANTRNCEQYSVQTLEGHAMTLVTKLALKRRETSTEERPIVFIAHSFGGIVLKSALIHAHFTNNEHLPEHKAIALSTYGLVFLGTPHQGSETANLATVFLDVLSIFRETNTPMIKVIHENSADLQRQLSLFVSISMKFNTKFCYETRKTRTIGGAKKVIVSKSSAVVPGAVNAEPIAIEKDHRGMNKFKSENDDDFKTISMCLYLMARDAPTKITMNWEQYKGADPSPSASKVFGDLIGKDGGGGGSGGRRGGDGGHGAGFDINLAHGQLYMFGDITAGGGGSGGDSEVTGGRGGDGGMVRIE